MERVSFLETWEEWRRRTERKFSRILSCSKKLIPRVILWISQETELGSPGVPEDDNTDARLDSGLNPE